MIKTPEIKGWDCMDYNPIESWVPEDPADVEFWCNLAIGVVGEDGADNYQVHIVTKKALSRIGDKRYTFVISYYESWPQVLQELQAAIEKCKDRSWLRISRQLSSRFLWEYESAISL